MFSYPRPAAEVSVPDGSSLDDAAGPHHRPRHRRPPGRPRVHGPGRHRAPASTIPLGGSRAWPAPTGPGSARSGPYAELHRRARWSPSAGPSSGPRPRSAATAPSSSSAIPARRSGARATTSWSASWSRSWTPADRSTSTPTTWPTSTTPMWPRRRPPSRRCARLPLDQRPWKVVGIEGWRSLDWLGDDEKVLLDVTGLDELAARLAGGVRQPDRGRQALRPGRAGPAPGQRHAAGAPRRRHATELTFAFDLTPLVHNDGARPGDASWPRPSTASATTSPTALRRYFA